jgi:hypothetical protein
MANRDIAGLLTGIPSGGIDPRAQASSRPALMQSALKNQQRMGGALRNMTGGSAPVSEQLALGIAKKEREMSNLDLTNPQDLEKLAKLQQASGDLTGAATTIGKAQQLKQIQARKASLLKVARAQGNELVEEYIITAGDTDAALNKIQEVLFRRDPSPKSSSAPTKGDIALYTKLLEQYTDKELEGLGLETSFSFFGQGGVDDADKLIIINSAKEIATNFPKLGKKGALAEALRQYGINKSTGSTSTETPTDTDVIESSSLMTGKKIR